MMSTTRLLLLRRKRSRTERLAWLPILAALAGMWVLAIMLTLSERRFTLERVKTQLAGVITTLADFHELADLATGEAMIQSADTRMAAIWRALLQYPTASIWVETDGVISGGDAPLAAIDDAIVVQEARENFTVHAALPRADALVEWRRSAWQRGLAALIASVVFLLLSMFLIRALKQRTVAVQEAGKQRERATALARFKAQLEDTVIVRTEELRESNELLEGELIERKAVEAALKEHDALLHAVAMGAEELLGSRSLEDATTTVLALIGQTVAVSRVHISTITAGRDGQLRSSVRHEWCAADMMPVAGNPALQELDLAETLPQAVAPLLGGRLTTFSVDELSGGLKELFEQNGMRSCLQIPIMVDDKLWGNITFIDSAQARRQWNWAETDTLQTLAGLFGVSIAKERYVKELADANMIVQNSPTIL
jgi:hypothetical protein